MGKSYAVKGTIMQEDKRQEYSGKCRVQNPPGAFVYMAYGKKHGGNKNGCCFAKIHLFKFIEQIEPEKSFFKVAGCHA